MAQEKPKKSNQNDADDTKLTYSNMILGALEAIAKSVASDAIKEHVSEYLNDVMRLERSIRRTAVEFSTELPGISDSLKTWVEGDAFRSDIQRLTAGDIPEDFVNAELFIEVTGIGFCASPVNTVRTMLFAFYANIREDLIGKTRGLILLDKRVGEAISRISDLNDLLRASSSQVGFSQISEDLVNEIVQKLGRGKETITFGSHHPMNLEIPPSAENMVRRHTIVEKIRGILQTKAWYSIFGGTGSGKTQLLRLTVESFDGPKLWVRLSSPFPPLGLVLEALGSLAVRQRGESIQQWCEKACRVIGPGGVIVLDDLPTRPQPELDELLVTLCSACAISGVRLISSSPSPLPTGTRIAVASRLHEEAIPEFLEEEAVQLFKLYGAPESFLASKWVRLVYGASKRHPVLIVEAARYLLARGWVADDRSLDDLINGKFASDLDLQIIRRIRDTVPDDSTRDFLYRLKLIGWPFGTEEVYEVSSVAPQLSFPMEHLASVVDLWVQRDSELEYVVSPLVSSLGHSNLPKELRQGVHLALARGILNKRRLGPVEASKAFGHFVASGDFDSAAFVLLVAWRAMLSSPEIEDPLSLTSFWAGAPMPEKLSLEIRICLRAIQVSLRRRLAITIEFERADLEDLINQGKSEPDCQLAVAVAGATIAFSFGESDPGFAIRYLRDSIEASRAFVRQPGDQFNLTGGILTILWALVAWIRTDEQYREWFAVVRILTSAEIRAWASLGLAWQGSEIVCSGIWSRAADRPKEERNWTEVEIELVELATWAHRNGVTPVEAAAFRAQVIVLADYGKSLENAEFVARTAIEQLIESPRSRFLVAEVMARQYYYFGDHANSLRWFDEALKLKTSVDTSTRVATLTIAGVAAHSVDVCRAQGYLEEGVSTSTNAEVRTFTRVRVRGELGVQLWHRGQQREAYAVLNLAARELLEAPMNTLEWKTLFRMFGNCTGYFLLIARGIREDNRNMTVPFPGILLRELSDTNELDKPVDQQILRVQMALLAESVGFLKDALDWATRAKSDDKALSATQQYALDGILTAGRIGRNQYLEVVEAADIGDLDESLDVEQFSSLDDCGMAERARRFSGRVSLVALAVEFARLGLSQNASADLPVGAAAVAVNAIGSRYTDSRLWIGVAEVFDSLRDRQKSWRELWQRAVEARLGGNSALQVMYGIAAISVAGPNEAIRLQLQIVPWLETVFGPTLYNTTVARFVPEYWSRAIEQHPMRFGMLKRTRMQLEEAQKLEDKQKVHLVLRAVAFSVSDVVPSEVQAWLDSI